MLSESIKTETIKNNELSEHIKDYKTFYYARKFNELFNEFTAKIESIDLIKKTVKKKRKKPRR